jgi:hypothetical protein
MIHVAFYPHYVLFTYIALQEKILPFLSVNDAVKLPQETTPLDELEAEIVPIPYGQVTDKAHLRADSKREAVSGAAAARSRGQQSAAGQVLLDLLVPLSQEKKSNFHPSVKNIQFSSLRRKNKFSSPRKKNPIFIPQEEKNAMFIQDVISSY